MFQTLSLCSVFLPFFFDLYSNALSSTIVSPCPSSLWTFSFSSLYLVLYTSFSCFFLTYTFRHIFFLLYYLNLCATSCFSWAFFIYFSSSFSFWHLFPLILTVFLLVLLVLLTSLALFYCKIQGFKALWSFVTS